MNNTFVINISGEHQCQMHVNFYSTIRQMSFKLESFGETLENVRTPVIKCKYYFVTKIFSEAVIENRNLEPLVYRGSRNGVTCDGNSGKLLATSFCHTV